MKKKTGNIIKFAVCSVLLIAAYFPTFIWMIDRWLAKESYYGHGFLIPIISLYFIWQKRDALKNVKASSNMLGLWIVGSALIVNMICAALKIYFISGFSFVVAAYGLCLFLFGGVVTKILIFPVLFLAAMVPLPLVLIGNITVKLKLFAAQVAAFSLNHTGFPCVRDGSLIRMPKSFISVDAPCSGLRSLISLLTLGLIFAYVSKMSYVKKWVLFLSSIPIALTTNVIRIMLLAMVNDLYGEKAAMGFFHDFTGFLVFAIAFAALFGVSKILEPRVYEAK